MTSPDTPIPAEAEILKALEAGPIAAYLDAAKEMPQAFYSITCNHIEKSRDFDAYTVRAVLPRGALQGKHHGHMTDFFTAALLAAPAITAELQRLRLPTVHRAIYVDDKFSGLESMMGSELDAFIDAAMEKDRP